MRAVFMLKLMMLILGSSVAAHAAIAVEASAQNPAATRQQSPLRVARIGSVATLPVAPADVTSVSQRNAATVATGAPLQPHALKSHAGPQQRARHVRAAQPDMRLAALAPDELFRPGAPSTPATAAANFASASLAANTMAGSNMVFDQQQSNLAALQHPASRPRVRSAADFLLLALVGLILIAYQLCRKHRFLRPQPFTL